MPIDSQDALARRPAFSLRGRTMEDGVFRIRLETPASGKNRQRIIGFGERCRSCGKPKQRRILKSKEAKADEDRIRAAVQLATIRDELPLFGDDDVSVLVHYYALSDQIDVEVRSIRPRPPGFSGRRRDLHNIPDVLLDAMQGVIVANDNQVCRMALARYLDR